MKETFRIFIADKIELVNKLKKYNTEDWTEKYSDEIFDKMYDSGYDLSESVDYVIKDDSIIFYFITTDTVDVCEIETDRSYVMRAEEQFVGSAGFIAAVEDNGFLGLFDFCKPVDIISVIHDDVYHRVIYNLRKFTEDGGKQETIEFTDDFIDRCLEKDNEDNSHGVLKDRILSGESAIEM